MGSQTLTQTASSVALTLHYTAPSCTRDSSFKRRGKLICCFTDLTSHVANEEFVPLLTRLCFWTTRIQRRAVLRNAIGKVKNQTCISNRWRQTKLKTPFSRLIFQMWNIWMTAVCEITHEYGLKRQIIKFSLCFMSSCVQWERGGWRQKQLC